VGLVGLVAGWAGDRPAYTIVDGAYAGRGFLCRRPASVQIINRLRMDAALWT
jgi:hypothetical protein